MVKWSGVALVLLGAAHLVAFGIEALPFVPRWLGLELWAAAHGLSFAAQPSAFLASNAAFWATLGSCAAPSILLGALIVRLADQGVAVPTFVGWGLCVWFAVCALLVEPSGFPMGLIISLALLLGLHRQRRAAAPAGERRRAG
jgi:hypothetical protein